MKGFGLISLILTGAIIGMLVFGGFYYNKDKKKNQIQIQQDAIQDAKDAADQTNQYNQSIQTELDAGGGVNYRAVQQKLK